jgi:hypothetical protein
MTETSARFALPLLLPGQAQKEIFHNEALTRLDCAVHGAVEAGPLSAPPDAPVPGQGWIVAPPATGDWAGMEHALATWTAGGWRFVAPVAGMALWNKAGGYWLHWSGSAWIDGILPATALAIGGQQVVAGRQPAVPSPSGGTTIDMEARAAIEALIATLKSHGLTD